MTQIVDVDYPFVDRPAPSPMLENNQKVGLVWQVSRSSDDQMFPNFDLLLEAS
jgi:hypothetical protein